MADITDNTAAEPDVNTENGATVLLELETTIKNHISLIDKNKAELKKEREMLESALLNDETYRLHTEEAKKTAKTKALTKYQIMQLPANKGLADKVKDLSTATKDLERSLMLSENILRHLLVRLEKAPVKPATPVAPPEEPAEEQVSDGGVTE